MRVAPFLLIPMLFAPAARAVTGGPPGRFTIDDMMAPTEIAENTALYIDGKLQASFHLDANTPERSLSVEVADALGPHAYALCGTITVRRQGGLPETHEVDSAGVIADVDGRRFEALGAADFTFFYLADPTPGRVPAAPSRDRSPLCHPPLS